VHPDEEPRYLFTGIYIVSPAFLARIPAATKISVIPLFHEMIRGGAKLGGVIADDGHWWDLGNREQYLAVHRELAAGTPLLASGLSPLTHPAPWISPGAEIAPGAVVSGASAIGEGVKVASGARVHDSIIWPGAEIAADSHLTECVVTESAHVSGRHSQADL
jgi:NDP-sugar pyrophosphorylase family protein